MVTVPAVVSKRKNGAWLCPKGRVTGMFPQMCVIGSQPMGVQKEEGWVAMMTGSSRGMLAPQAV